MVLSAVLQFLVAATLIELTPGPNMGYRSEEHTSELQSRRNLVCRLLLEKKKQTTCHSRRRKPIMPVEISALL